MNLAWSHVPVLYREWDDFSIDGPLKTIRTRGFANLDWTDAGLWEGNDYHHPFPLCLQTKHRLDMPSRHYRPVWIKDAQEMYVELDITRNRLIGEMNEEERWNETIARLDEARQRFVNEKKASLDLFDLEFDR